MSLADVLPCGDAGSGVRTWPVGKVVAKWVPRWYRAGYRGVPWWLAYRGGYMAGGYHGGRVPRLS